jgi:hypothetical protein
MFQMFQKYVANVWGGGGSAEFFFRGGGSLPHTLKTHALTHNSVGANRLIFLAVVTEA